MSKNRRIPPQRAKCKACGYSAVVRSVGAHTWAKHKLRGDACRDNIELLPDEPEEEPAPAPIPEPPPAEPRKGPAQSSMSYRRIYGW